MKKFSAVAIGLVLLAVLIGVLRLVWPAAVWDWQSLTLVGKVGLVTIFVAFFGGYIYAVNRWWHKLPG